MVTLPNYFKNLALVEAMKMLQGWVSSIAVENIDNAVFYIIHLDSGVSGIETYRFQAKNEMASKDDNTAMGRSSGKGLL
ncbi:hypothetical protein AB9P05_16310 [Roseivirga sp. BDSF3-8]|uniref:hypothetical protein n=1 Tax=Roseivirga sp. BDSF3-8 TaxID=3241598 RepID=UPI00353235AC